MMGTWSLRTAASLAAGVLGAAAPAAGQDGTPAGVKGPPAACTTDEHHQFDFWIGTWEVRNPAGRRVGTNAIERMLGGCVLRETWESAGAHAGTSYNIYDASRGVWHQTWVDNGGLLLQLEGGLEGEAMVLSGETVDDGGTRVLNRITWTPISTDRVRQVWETSRDDGASWTTIFDGLYQRRE